MAHGRTVLGLAALPGDPATARAHLEAAQRWTAATGEVEVDLRCAELSARIALAERRFVAAAALAREGRELAETTGFGLFACASATWRPPLRWRPARRGRAPGDRRGAGAGAARPAYAWGLADALHTGPAPPPPPPASVIAPAICSAKPRRCRARLGHPGLRSTEEALAEARREGPKGRRAPPS